MGSVVFITPRILSLMFSHIVAIPLASARFFDGLPYPPGPRPLPLIGNLIDIPREFSWLTYTQLSKKYSDIISLHAFGQVIVVLNSIKVNKDLLEKRPDIYSDRPLITIFDMMGWYWNLGLGNCTEEWRLGLKLLNRGLRPANIVTYRPMLEAKAYMLLSDVLANPDELEAHLNHVSGSLVLAMAYGYEVLKKMVQVMGEVAFPGALLINVLPCLRHIPKWLPWLSYRPLARFGYDIGQEVLHVPMEFARESMRNGTAQPSLALEILREMEKVEKSEREKMEETPSSLMPFFVAILLRPDVQTMAQKELDAVTMRERLPTFEDRPRLPFVDAICKEVKRWKPAVPLGIPRATASDDVYEGYFIPKGWAVLHDPVMYPEPDSFKPERFINPDGSAREDPVLSTIFGLGKRICPGRHLADAVFFIIIASFLSAFNIKGDGADGGPDKYPFTGSGVSVPCPFTCSITPRDKRAEELIAANAEALRPT
ncbi:Cytochrome P450 [Russula decolorans]